MPTLSTDHAGDPGQAPLLAGRYELRATLGHGGMADVYRGLDRVLDREVAVKMLRQSSAEESDRSRFISEARTLARLSHSGLVTVLDAGFGQDTRALPPGVPPSAGADQAYLVMELVAGPTLAVTISRGALPIEEVGAIGVQLGQALGYVHAHDVVHRDIKPGNVLLGTDGRVKLADFGIARLLGDTARHTRTGHAVGTAAYIAPEQVTGDEVSGATDVYSLGLVLLEALTGRREYPGTATEAALARLHRAPRIPEDLPDQWQQLLAAMTALEPAGRPSAEAVAQLLGDQPTGPIPVVTHDTADPTTVPLLNPGSQQVKAHPSSTKVLPDVAPTEPDRFATGTDRRSTQSAWVERAGDALARQPSALADRLRGLTTSQRGVLAAVTALVLMIVVVALVNGSSGDGREPPQVPDNTPTELRGPLQQLHDAVNGEAGS